MNIKGAIDKYYSRLKDKYISDYGTNPTVSYDEAINKQLLISDVNDDGEVEWKPCACDVENSDIFCNEIEVKISAELMEYYTAYWFMHLSGKLDNIKFDFIPNGASHIKEFVLQQYKDGKYYFPSQQCFLIGYASIDGNDDYFVFYDNAKGALFCYDEDLDVYVKLEKTIAEIICSMEVCI